MDGWIKLHRKILDWQWYPNVNVRLVFLHLLLRANHNDCKWMGEVVSRGQVVVGRIELAKQVGISVRNVRTAIIKLKSTNELTSKSTNKYTIITINNYDKYQSTDQQNDKQLTSNRPATDHKQECKKDKNTYTSKNYLITIPLEDLEQISKDLGVNNQTITLKGKRLYDWCEANGKTYKNYKAFLKNCLRSDLEKTQPVNLLKGGVRYEDFKRNLPSNG